MMIAIVHTTYAENLPELFRTGRLMTPLERFERRVDARGVMSVEDIDFGQSSYAFGRHQFPGVYFDVIPSGVAASVGGWWGKGTVKLVFPVDLLDQENWHLNLVDQNGFINRNTYVRETLHAIPDLQKFADDFKKAQGFYPGNELIVHDGVSMGLLHAIWVRDAAAKAEVEKLVPSSSSVRVSVAKSVPKKPVVATAEQRRRYLDLESKPVLGYFLDANYTGIKTGRKTPMSVQRMVAINAGVPPARAATASSPKELDAMIGAKGRLRKTFAERPTPRYWPPFY